MTRATRSARRATLLTCIAVATAACARPGAASATLAASAATLVAIAEAGPAAVAQWPAAQAALDSPSLVDLAIWTLGELGPGAAAAVPRLLALPAAGNPLRHAGICITLGHLGVRDSAVQAYLDAAAHSPFVTVRQAARGALSNLGS